jgi:Flp pilus assembly protein TadD
LLQNDPDEVEALHLLGQIAREAGKLDKAVTLFERAVEIRPDSAGLHNSLGSAMGEMGRAGEAERSLRAALRLEPALADAQVNLANLLRRRGDLDEAVALCRSALRLRPELAEAVNTLGTVLQDQGYFPQAAAAYEEAVRLRPHYVEARLNCAMSLLQAGDFARGWEAFEWRKRLPPAATRIAAFRTPAWDGSEAAGRTILVHAEYGLGTTLQFVRYVPLLAERGPRVILECHSALKPLLKSLRGTCAVVEKGEPLPEHDAYVPLLSLPHIFGTVVDTIPAAVPYLSPEPQRLRNWAAKLGGISGLRVGIAWQGSPTYVCDRSRSLPLSSFAPLAAVPGVRLVSLQKGPAEAELASAECSCLEVVNLGHELDRDAAFVDTAAVMQNLDLVVTSDTSVAHLAGALAVPVWVALSHSPDWRWMLGREESPWYPTMRLFRQEQRGAWDSVFRRMAAALEPLTGAAHPSAIQIEVGAGELIDKITILQIKSERITDGGKLAHVREELRTLSAARARSVIGSDAIDVLAAQLRSLNERLWESEDRLRECERAQAFDARFVELARSVYQLNDERAAAKRRINDLLNSAHVEEKWYLESK